MLYYNVTAEEALDHLKSSPGGLSHAEAARRQMRYGKNELVLKGEPLWRKLLTPFLDVFMAVLFIAAIISVVHHAVMDAAIIIAIIVVSAIIYYVQQFSTERILRSLRKKNNQKVSVMRSDSIIMLDVSELVPGDIIFCHEGDKVPADLRLIEVNGLKIDESVLTGESVAVDKTTRTIKGVKEVYERTNTAFQGSFIIGGSAKGLVTGTGNDTEFGHIAALAEQSRGQSPVQAKIDKLLRFIIAGVSVLAIVAFILSMIRGTELTEALRFVIALSVSAVPESLPVAISVVLVLGMRRMAIKKALVRTMHTIETIGIVTTIATDKTGTLTKNQLSVQEVWQLPGSHAHLASTAHRSINHHETKHHDPLDVAMSEYTSSEKVEFLKGEPLSKLPFDQGHAMSGNIWHHDNAYYLNVKGAPEGILDRSDLTEGERAQADHALHSLTSMGYRVVALATTKVSTPIASFDHLQRRHTFNFVGFVAVADTLRPEAKRAIASAIRAGITVRMITGDHFETAYQIGRTLGLVSTRDQVFDSRLMNHMSDSELKKAIERSLIFSRVIPENKFRLLSILKETNITAMTGDGVNDVPALTKAHVGISMGSGSQIAKDASDIILLDDNFRSIIAAIKEGRTMFSNIRRMLFYLLSTNTGEALTMVGALALGMPVPLAPVQILWINLVTDTAMVIPLGLEPGEKDVMNRGPVRPSSPILSWYMIGRIVLVAVTMAIVALFFYAHFAALYGHAYGQTIAFSALAVMQWANAFNARSTYESVFSRLKTWNGPFYAGLAAAVLLQLLALFGPLSGVLHISPVSASDLLVTTAGSFALLILIVEVHKSIGRRLFK
ncbi:MAG: pacL2 [Candidatus Saccharibacteria bacterium]|nr:pacL2 [Candidatus Saccharibacteria bacterium]